MTFTDRRRDHDDDHATTGVNRGPEYWRVTRRDRGRGLRIGGLRAAGRSRVSGLANFDWAQPVWSPSRWISIDSADETPRITVTNSAVEYASVSLTKVLDNPEGVDVSGLTYDVEWWLDGEAQPTLTLDAGQTVTGDRFPVGSILEAAEPALVDPPGGTWEAPVWSIDGEALPVQDNGRVVGPVSSRDDGVIAFTVENSLRADGPTPPVDPTPPSGPDEPGGPSGALPGTGGSVPVVPIVVAALLLLLGGAIALIARRRRSD